MKKFFLFLSLSLLPICTATSANATISTINGVRYSDVSSEIDEVRKSFGCYGASSCDIGPSISCSLVEWGILHGLWSSGCKIILTTSKDCSSQCSACSVENKTQCLDCRDGYTLFVFGSSTICQATGTCPENATCNGTTITCNSGYTELNGSCAKKSEFPEVDDIEAGTITPVKSCPPETYLSDDGCCCLNL